MSGKELRLNLEQIVFIGRTFEEYVRIFNLTEDDLIGRTILDCPAGACSFTALANRWGANATAADIAYFHPIDHLLIKGFQDIEHTLLHLEDVPDNYVWDFFQSTDDLRYSRTNALSDCLADMKQMPDRYIPSVLPLLPFDDNTFDLTLSAHFLFMYADRLDYDFHLQTVRELMRVTRGEVRLFPLVDLSSKRYDHLDKLLAFISDQGWQSEEVWVPYEFQRKADHMLRIKKV